MKKILALAAVAALTAGVSAYAANPFSDVSTDDWAYQAVADLSDHGVVEGYPDGTFKGERNMTRYELAQIIARLMAKEDQLNAEQQATLDKLAGEYADELSNLGVRVSNLEKKVGNLYWSGDARMRYQDTAKKGADKYNGRIRLNVKGQVNDNTTVQARLVNNMDFKGDNTSSTIADRIYVTHKFGDTTSITLGRQPLTIFGGLEYDDQYDGAQVAYKDGKFDAKVAFGQLNASDIAAVTGKAAVAATYKPDPDNPGKFIVDTPAKEEVKAHDMFLGQMDYDFDFAKLGAAYVGFQGSDAEKTIGFNSIWGVNLVVPVQEFRVFGEYWKSNANDNNKTWQAGLGYGTLDLKKPGSFTLDVAYNRVGQDAYFGGTTYQVNDFFSAGDKEMKFWNAVAQVALQKNVYLRGEVAFDIDGYAKDKEAKYDDSAWNVSLNYKF